MGLKENRFLFLKVLSLSFSEMWIFFFALYFPPYILLLDCFIDSRILALLGDLSVAKPNLVLKLTLQHIIPSIQMLLCQPQTFTLMLFEIIIQDKPGGSF